MSTIKAALATIPMLLGPLPAWAEPEPGDWLWRERCNSYQVDKGDLEILSGLFQQTFNAPEFPATMWRKAGFDVKELDWPPGPVHAVRESAEKCRGRGAYLFRTKGLAVALQAPHRFKDLDTGQIQLRLMRQGGFSAAAWNSAPRNTPMPDGTGKADLARLAKSPFTLFAQAFVRNNPDGQLVQIHGFRRDDSPQRNFAAIISNGSRLPDHRVDELAHCLNKIGVAPAARYGVDSMILGGTRNPVGRLLRQTGSGQFVHLELARTERKRLRRETPLIKEMADCLLTGYHQQ